MSAARTYLDGAGMALTDYPRPSVAVDTAVLTVSPDDGQLRVLLVRREGRHRRGAWTLPGTFLHQDERLIDAVVRSLADKVGVRDLRPLQLQVFDDPRRDDRGWVLSVAHLVSVPWGRLGPVLEDKAKLRLTPVAEAVGLAFDHDAIVSAATTRLREEYSQWPDPAHLLDEPFSLRRLQQLHEAVAGSRLPKDTFRRGMEPHLRPTGDVQVGVAGKPARLFLRS